MKKGTIFEAFPRFFKVFSPLAYPKFSRKDLSYLAMGLHGGSMILDLGSGTGIPSIFLFRERPDLRFVLLDISISMLRMAKKDSLRVVGDAESLPFKNHKFDLVISGFSFHHFLDCDRVIQEMRRVVKPAGAIYILEIDPESWIGKLVRGIESLFLQGISFISPERMMELAKRHGFSVSLRRYGWRYAVLGKASIPSI